MYLFGCCIIEFLNRYLFISGFYKLLIVNIIIVNCEGFFLVVGEDFLDVDGGYMNFDKKRDLIIFVSCCIVLKSLC